MADLDSLSNAELTEELRRGIKEEVRIAVAIAIEKAAQDLYAQAQIYSNRDDEVAERIMCGAAELVRRSINPEF